MSPISSWVCNPPPLRAAPSAGRASRPHRPGPPALPGDARALHGGAVPGMSTRTWPEPSDPYIGAVSPERAQVPGAEPRRCTGGAASPRQGGPPCEWLKLRSAYPNWLGARAHHLPAQFATRQRRPHQACLGAPVPRIVSMMDIVEFPRVQPSAGCSSTRGLTIRASTSPLHNSDGGASLHDGRSPALLPDLAHERAPRS
jgi:hypothetical protein